MSEENKIRDAADAIKGVVEAVPVYQDVVQPAAKEVGTALQTVAKTLHILLAPVSGLVWGYEKIKDFVGNKVAEKLENVPEERLRSPEPHVAGPALEALKYTGYQEGLREMYANLLATSIDSRTAHAAHPSFVEIIRQMSPDEALIMKSLSVVRVRPFVDVRSEKKGSHLGYWAIKHFSIIPHEAGCKCIDLGPTYLVNLQRLGLVELREQYTLGDVGSDLYQPLRDAPEIKRIASQIESSGENKPEISCGAIILTQLGQQFCYACIYENTHENK